MAKRTHLALEVLELADESDGLFSIERRRAGAEHGQRAS